MFQRLLEGLIAWRSFTLVVYGLNFYRCSLL